MERDPDHPELTEEQVGDIFSEFGQLFGDFFGESAPGSNGDVNVNLLITPQDAADGVEKTVEVSAGECAACTGPTCTSCDGRGSTQRTQGFFMVESTCTRCTRGVVRPKSCQQCHGTGAAHTSVAIQVPAGVESGQTLRLAGAGTARGAGVGDLHVHIVVQDIELPRASVRGATKTIWPFALMLAGALALAAAATLIF